jgi:hypothetical protein
MADTGSESADSRFTGSPIEARVTRHAGGQHLVYRVDRLNQATKSSGRAIISSFEGPVLAFYGFGQIWVTHRKVRRINSWWLRLPRIGSQRLSDLVDRLEPDIFAFLQVIRKLDLSGTLVIERFSLEFHWTVRPGQSEKHFADNVGHENALESAFHELSRHFARWQLVGEEGVDDTAIGDVVVESRFSKKKQ